MAKKRKTKTSDDSLLKAANSAGAGSGAAAYRHKQARRKNNPPAKIAAEGVVPIIPKAAYEYNPHRPPVLRFDPDGGPDDLPALIAAAKTRALTDEEAQQLADALRTQEPWLEWAEKREQHRRGFFEVDPVSLNIHERVSAQAILKVAARQDVERSLFADPELEYHEAVQFYQHDIDWTNRLVLGDSLQVMSSLARRENLAGKVQMIYLDPPYGIKFASNFQPEVGKRDVKDKDADLTREPEMVKAYQDTWHLGIHSYLSYLRDRLYVAKELLADTGSIFVQISDENLHRVRMLLDEVFRADQFVAVITFKTNSGTATTLIKNTNDFILWFCKRRDSIKYNKLYSDKAVGVESYFDRKLLDDGRVVAPDSNEAGRYLAYRPIVSSGFSERTSKPFVFRTREYRPGANRHWKTTIDGLRRLESAERIYSSDATIKFVVFHEDFALQEYGRAWDDTMMLTGKVYAVQTSAKVIERCMLMTSDPGDIVLDPTCGSGTTAAAAEKWGRRWITIDTSRVAVAIARQRLMTARYEHYRLRPINEDDRRRNPDGSWLWNGESGLEGPLTFDCKTVPHITLKSIAQNANLDPIFKKYDPILHATLSECNRTLARVTDKLRDALALKLAKLIATDGWRAPSDADYRRWLLPGTTKAMIETALATAFATTKKKVTAKQKRGLVECIPARAEVGKSIVSKSGIGWEHWQVPFDGDDDWPKALRDAVTAYRAAWRAKMDEVNDCIAGNAAQEELVDQPAVVRGVVRVSGPFTVEAVQPPEMSMGDIVSVNEPAEFDGAPESLDATFDDLSEAAAPRSLRYVETRGDIEAQNAAAYLQRMYELLRDDGVTFPNNKHMVWASEDDGLPLKPMFEDGRANLIHAEGQWMEQGQSAPLDDRVAVAIGPQYGPVTAKMVEDLIRSTNRAGYDALVIAAFSFDGAAQAVIDEAAHPKLKIHMAHIRPDANPAMEGLLKKPAKQKGGQGKSAAASQQLFSVFGQPRVALNGPDKEGEYVVRMEGVDIYDPVENVIRPTRADKVAAWFLDGDYDGRTFCITQAFFPDRSAWEKLAKALKGVIDEGRFAALSGTESLPFPTGKHKAAAVKVIDPRGNEVMKVVELT